MSASERLTPEQLAEWERVLEGRGEDGLGALVCAEVRAAWAEREGLKAALRVTCWGLAQVGDDLSPDSKALAGRVFIAVGLATGWEPPVGVEHLPEAIERARELLRRVGRRE